MVLRPARLDEEVAADGRRRLPGVVLVGIRGLGARRRFPRQQAVVQRVAAPGRAGAEVPVLLLLTGQRELVLLAPDVVPHHVDEDRGLVHDAVVVALQVVVEPAEAERQVVHAGAGEVHVADAVVGRRPAVDPGADDELLLPAALRSADLVHLLEVAHGAVDVPVVPAAEVVDGHVELLVLLVHRELPPVVVVVGVPDEVVVHVREHAGGERIADLAVLVVPRGPRLAGAQVAPMSRDVHPQRLHHLPLGEQPGRQDHVERPALPEDVPVAVRRVLRTEHRLEVGRLGGGGQELVRAGEREPVGSHLPAGQRVPGRPLDGVVAVLALAPALVHEPVVLALGLVAAAFVLRHGDVPPRGEVLGGGTGAAALVIGGALQHHRERPRPLAAGKIDVGGEASAVPHRDHHLFAGPVLGGGERREQADRGQRRGQAIRKTDHRNLHRATFQSSHGPRRPAKSARGAGGAQRSAVSSNWKCST